MKKITTNLFAFLFLPYMVSSQCATSSAPTNNCSFGDQINAFALNSISAIGNSGCGASGYNSFASPVWTLQVGSNYNWTASVGSGLYNEGVGIWIDLNNDGSYATTEFVGSSPSAQTHASILNIPFSAVVNTNLRMRVRCAYASAVTNAQACTNSIGFGYGETEDYFVYLTCPASLPTVTIAASSTVVCSSNPVTLTASGLATYTWSGGITNGVAFVPSLTAAYNLTASINNPGCPSSTSTAVRTISVNTTPTITGIASGSTCPGVSFVMTPGGANTYTYTSPTASLTGPSATVTPIANTSYTVSGTATNGCVTNTASAGYVSVTTLVSPTLVVAANPASVCPGAASNLTVSGANTFTWTAPASNATLVSVSPTATSIYTVSGTGTNVCNGVKTVTLFVFGIPTIAVNSGSICAGQTFTMVPSGASTYTFSGPTNTNVVSPATTTLYTVAGTNTITGCVSSSLTAGVSNVTVVALPVITVSSGTVCNGSQYVILASGASNYTFVNSSNPVTPTITTSYTVVGRTPTISSCVSLPAISNVTVFNLPTLSVTATPSTMVICNTDPINLTVSGAATYTWNNTSVGATFSATPSSNISYFAVATDTNGCTNVVTSQVTVNPLPAMSVASNTNFICNGGSATITAAGASTYSWSNATSSTNIVVTPTVSTVYGVTGTSSLGCSKTLTFAVNVNTITMSVSSNTAICKGNSADLVASGPTSFTWNPANGPFGSIQVTPNVTTTYTVTGKDSKNCFHTSAVTVTVNANPTISAGSSTSLMCVGETLTLTASGANTYVWSLNTISTGTGSSLVLTPSNSGTNNYITSGTDNNGCVNADTVTVKVDKCTGLSKFNNSNSGVSVYPNPNRGEFTVELNNGLDKTIEVADVTGRIVASTISNTDKTALNLNGFANGIYYVKIQSNTTVEVIRVIKQ